MSGYDKSQNPYVHDYDQATRPTHDPRLPLPYTQTAPSYVPHAHFTPSSQATETHGLAVPTENPLLGGSYPPPRDSSSYQHSSSSFIDERARITPEIISNGPFQSDSEGKLRILLRSSIDYFREKFTFLISFDFQRCQGTLNKDFVQRGYHHYTLTVDVPHFQASPKSTMALLLEIQDENHATVDTKSLGHFIYHAQSFQRKRKHANDPSEYTGAKRSASQPLQPSKFKDSPSVYPGPPMTIPGAGSYQNTLYSIPSYDRPTAQRSPYSSQTISHRPSMYQSLSPNLAPGSMRVRRSPVMSQYGSSSYLTQGQSPRMSQVSAPSMTRSLSTASNPTLVRTTTLRTPSVTPVAYSTTPTFNPYDIYPNTKATLNIAGDLSTMCENWTREEKLAKRRLVEFSRSQTGSNITASFKAVTPEERQPNNPCISCIYWERKRQHYVTSVDTIALLEAIIAVRFTVEEKNRIRRNLEGFKPDTVSKAKDEYDDIFKLIMGFPNPKPRNIEKDIKIFPWPILEQALKKIVSKYSASYASTSSVITPRTATYGSTMSESAEQQLSTASPESTAVSSVPTAYQTSMTSSGLSPSLVTGSAGLDIGGGGGHHQQGLPLPQSQQQQHSDLRPPQMFPSGASTTHMSAWQTPPYPSQYAARGTWDMGSYLDQGNSGSAGMAPAGAQPSTMPTYYRSDDDGNARQDDPRYVHQTSRP